MSINQKFLFCLTVVWTAVFVRGASVLDPVGEEVTLGDMNDGAIVVPAQADKATRHAAAFLAKSIKAMCGVDLPIGETSGNKRSWAMPSTPFSTG